MSNETVPNGLMCGREDRSLQYGTLLSSADIALSLTPMIPRRLNMSVDGDPGLVEQFGRPRGQLRKERG
jgi:hypothetical protein